MIMGDVCETLQELLSEGGLDHNLLSAQEKESGDIEKHTYTEEEKMIIRQYEAAADRAKLFSKFLQTKGNNRLSYLLFEVQYVLHHHKRDYLCMSQGTLTCCASHILICVDQSLLTTATFRYIPHQRRRRLAPPPQQPCYCI